MNQPATKHVELWNVVGYCSNSWNSLNHNQHYRNRSSHSQHCNSLLRREYCRSHNHPCNLAQAARNHSRYHKHGIQFVIRSSTLSRQTLRKSLSCCKHDWKAWPHEPPSMTRLAPPRRKAHDPRWILRASAYAYRQFGL